MLISARVIDQLYLYFAYRYIYFFVYTNLGSRLIKN